MEFVSPVSYIRSKFFNYAYNDGESHLAYGKASNTCHY